MQPQSTGGYIHFNQGRRWRCRSNYYLGDAHFLEWCRKNQMVERAANTPVPVDVTAASRRRHQSLFTALYKNCYSPPARRNNVFCRDGASQW